MTRLVSEGVTLLADTRRPGGVTFAFTERTGGVSSAPYESLNVGINSGDDQGAVAANRSRIMSALGVASSADRVVSPLQVHGTKVVVIDDPSDEAVRRVEQEALQGADAVVCSVPDVPVMLCFADCVPVVLVAPGAFAVVHSGWRGSIERISAIALRELVAVAGCEASDVLCYVGPHIGAEDYEVSEELAERFRAEFGGEVLAGPRLLDLGAAVRIALTDEGVRADAIDDSLPSTASATDRFYSYRAEQGTCGRHAAVAVLRSDAGEEATDD